jgi:hypothetical protein
MRFAHDLARNAKPAGLPGLGQRLRPAEPGRKAQIAIAIQAIALREGTVSEEKRGRLSLKPIWGKRAPFRLKRGVVAERLPRPRKRAIMNAFSLFSRAEDQSGAVAERLKAAVC